MKSVNGPLVSFYMTVKNGEFVVINALESIINQTYKNLEIVVVDDGSSDGTVNSIHQLKNKDSRIKLIESGGVGRAGALNIAVMNAKGRYLFNLDADDYAHPERAERQLEFMRSKDQVFVASEALVVFGSEEPQWDFSVSDPEPGYRLVNDEIAFKNPINHSSIAFSRSLLGLFSSLYDESRVRQVDHDLFIRLAIVEIPLNLSPEKLVAKRVHSDQNFENKNRLCYLFSSFLLKFSASRKMNMGYKVYLYITLKFIYGTFPQGLRMRVRRWLF